MAKQKKQKQQQQPGAVSPSEIKVCANIARIREKQGLSQNEMAKRIGISPSYVSMMERGVRVPSLETIDTIAAALNVRAVDMLR